MEIYSLTFSLLILAIFGSECSGGVQPNEKEGSKVVCYYQAWLKKVEKIDTNLCTHIIYSFIHLKGNNLTRIDETQFGILVGLKKQNNHLKIILAVGGWNAGSKNFSNMASSAINRSIFVQKVYRTLIKNGFDGVDIDWEYPTKRGGRPEDRHNFVLLLQELKNKLGATLSVSVAVKAITSDLTNIYDIPGISNAVDFINVMTYNMKGYRKGVAGIHSQLYPRPSDTTASNGYTVDAVISKWVNNGADERKLILGIAIKATGYTLKNSEEHDINSLITGKVKDVDYDKFCGRIENGDLVVFRDRYAVTPYGYNKTHWYGFDDKISVMAKGQYARQHGLGGVMFWSILKDDVDGSCGHGKYPIINAAKNGLMTAK